MKPQFEPPAQAVPSTRPQIHALTSLRGIAAWWVVLFHFDTYLLPYIPAAVFQFIARGYLAVDLFFCLSGFVIFLNYGKLKIASPREIFAFYLRRLAKIYPLHLFTLGLYVLLVGAVILAHRDLPGPRFSLENFILNIFLVQDWTGRSDLTWNVPSWSISAEFAAYLLFPIVVMAVRSTAGRLFPCLLAIALLLCLLNYFFAPIGFDLGKSIGTYGVPRCIAQFTIGALLARIYLARTVMHRLAPLCLFAIAALSLIIGLTTMESVMVPLAWTALVLAIALADKNLGFLNHPWLIFVGDISYSTYMIHYFIRDVFKFLLVHPDQPTPIYYVLAAFGAVFAASVPLYLFVERPAHRHLVKIISARISPKRRVLTPKSAE
jgi:peptidoglycan/LPS O-acetylase OafA/YrhL